MTVEAEKGMNQLRQGILDLNVSDLIRIDHRFLKECIEVFSSPEGDKRIKLNKARSFLAAITLHSKAERKAVYLPLAGHPEFHFYFIESEKSHDEIDAKVKALRRRFNNTVYLKEEVEAELKNLSEMIKEHISIEEKEILPLLNEHLDDETLRILGCAFMAERKFTHNDLNNYPGHQDDLIQWKDNIQKISSEFLSKMDKFAESWQH